MPPSKSDLSTTVEKTKTKPSKTTPSKWDGSANKTHSQIVTEVAAEFALGQPSDQFKLIDNLASFLEVIELVQEIEPTLMAVDTETEGLKWNHRVIGVSFTFGDAYNYYIPFRHITEDFQPDIEDFVEGLNYLFNLPGCRYVFHNYKFDFHKLKKEGIVLEGPVDDTMIMHYVLDENGSHALKDLAAKHIDESAHHYEKLIKEFRRKLARRLKIKLSEFGFEHIPINIMVEYACRDTFFTYKLYQLFKPMVDESEDITKVYNLELGALHALAAMEEVGVKLDTNALGKVSARLGEELEALRQEVWEMVGEEFDLNSTKQLRDVLRSKGIHTHQTTPTGAMSTSAASLEKIASRFPFIQKLLGYRAKQKLKSTYADPLPSYCDDGGFIHCSYKQSVAVTGRITCKDPSLQVIPRNAGENDIRRAFVPPDDSHLMIFIDLSQIELRMTAHYSNDPLLINAYETGEDIHTRTAAEIFGVSMEEVQKPQRNAAKAINFGIIYGIGPKKLAEQISISQEEAYDYINKYLQRYAGVASFINKYQRLAKKNGFVKSYFGRTRHLDDLLDPDLEDWKRERGYRQAVNYVIQGCQHPDTPILTDQGYIPIRQLEGESLRTYSGYSDSYRVFPCGEQDVWEVKTAFGSTLNSPDHKYFVYNNEDLELRDTRDLKPGEHVLYQIPFPVTGRDTLQISVEDAELCGLLCSKGNFPCDDSEELYVKIPTSRQGHLNWAIDYVMSRWPDQWTITINGDQETGKGHTLSTSNAEVIAQFKEWGVEGVTSCNSFIPPWLYEASTEKQEAFLRGVFCNLAYFSNKQIMLKCPSYDYANSLQLLLTCVGITGSVHERKQERRDRQFLVKVLPSYVGHFKRSIGSRDVYTLQMIERASVDGNATFPKSLVKDVGAFIAGSEEYRKNEDSKFSAHDQSYVQQMKGTGYGRADKILGYLARLAPCSRVDNFRDLLDKGWASVLRVKDLGYSTEMLDIELEGPDHAYVGRGFFQHNSCADMFKITLDRLHSFLKDKKSKMVMNIHDEVIFYLHEDEFDLVGDIKGIFEQWDFRVPIIAEVQYSNQSWGNKQEL